MQGRAAPRASKSERSRAMPARPAIASRCTTALLEPPMAELTLIAFSNEARLSTLDIVTFSPTISTMRRPDWRARRARRGPDGKSGGVGKGVVRRVGLGGLRFLQ